MSIILRQSFKYTLIGYFGFLLGTIANLFVFPQDLEFYGKLRFIFPTAEMLVPMVVFGLSFANVKFFAQAQKEGKHQNLLSLSLLSILGNFGIFALGFFLLPIIFPNFQNTEAWQSKYFILPLIFALSISAVMNKYISNYKRIAIPNIFENLFPKLANIGAFSTFFFLKIPENWALIFFISFSFVAMLGYFFYNNRLEPFKFDFSLNYVLQNRLWNQILLYSFFGFLGNMGSFLALKIANVMIGEYISFEQNGLYSNIYSIVALINIPQMGLHNISAPIINKHLTDNTLGELNIFHKNTSLNLFFLGAVLFSCIVVGFPFLTDFIKNGNLLLQNQLLLWIIGGAMLFDLATGFNSHIISMSKFYKYNTFFMLILAGLTIGLNLFFLHYTNLGILGIAISYTTSLILFNLLKISFNYYHFKVFPLSLSMLWALLLCGFSVIFAWFLPNATSSFINLIYKPILVIFIIFVGNYFLKIYPLEEIYKKLKF